MVCQIHIIYTKTKSHATHAKKKTILISIQSNTHITFQICITHIKNQPSRNIHNKNNNMIWLTKQRISYPQNLTVVVTDFTTPPKILNSSHPP